MYPTALLPAKQSDDLHRRRLVLLSHIGTEVQLKRSALSPNHQLRGLAGRLLDVKRTRVIIDYGPLGEWFFPISAVLLPNSTEPAPGQRELFAVDMEGQP